MKNIVLIGMPGCGKSTFGKRMAKRLQLPFYDADSVLEEREQRTIKAFFAESEEAFREAETRTLAYLAECDGAVIATGGGAVKRAENMELLKRGGVVILSTANRKTSSDVLPVMRVRCLLPISKSFILYITSVLRCTADMRIILLIITAISAEFCMSC